MRSVRLAPMEAVERLTQRNRAAVGADADDEHPERAVRLSVAPEQMVRRVMGDLLPLEDHAEFFDEVLPRVAASALGGIVAEMLRNLAITVTPLEEPGDAGDEYHVEVQVVASEALHATMQGLVGQDITLGLMMRRQGDLILPPTSPVDLDKPPHGGRPE